MYLKWLLLLVILTASVSTICCEEIVENENENEINLNNSDDGSNSETTTTTATTGGSSRISSIIENIVNRIPSENNIYEILYNTNNNNNNESNDEMTLANTTTLLNNNDTTNVNVTQKTATALCKPNAGGEPVEIVNGTQLIKILLADPNVTKDVAGECVLILFYAKFCTFSSMAAPHFNALSRAFPDIKMAAIDAMRHHVFNTQNGIVGVPTLLLFYNGRPIGKFNETEYTLDLFSKFLTKYTALQPIDKSYVTSADFAGPVPSTPEKETDYFLGLSWLFICVCAVYYFSKSRWWKWIVEMIQNTWRESEAQHEHND